MSQTISEETKKFAADLEKEIQSKYESRGDKCGWGLLYSSAHVLERAEVAFIGLNPGGGEDSHDPDNPGGINVENSNYSAYRDEVWGGGQPAGEGVLQKQVLALFEKIGVERENAHNVLAGNLIPFRSPREKDLLDMADALDFSKKIWTKIFERVQPPLVITIGATTRDSVIKILGIKNTHPTKLCGKERDIKCWWGDFDGGRGRFVALPHLSTFRVVANGERDDILKEAFGDHWRG